jgi:hypothetical protein
MVSTTGLNRALGAFVMFCVAQLLESVLYRCFAEVTAHSKTKETLQSARQALHKLERFVSTRLRSRQARVSVSVCVDQYSIRTCRAGLYTR